MNNKVTPLKIAQSLTDFWSPKIISEVNDSYVKVAKLKGQFVWHDHEFEDEMFMILQGQLRIEFRDHKIDLYEGDVYIVPKGIEHNPYAEDECLVMIIENKTTLHTGAVLHQNSKTIEQQL